MQKPIYLPLAILISLLIISSCEKREVGTDQTINGKLISNSECKGLKSIDLSTDTPDSISLVIYSFNPSNNKLSLKHINAGFNCCPGNLTCEFKLVGDTIIIQEFEEAAQCRCNCLYDLEMEIDGIGTKKYQLKFIEPYAENLAPLIFELDLRTITSGFYNVVRNQYPWGTGIASE